MRVNDKKVSVLFALAVQTYLLVQDCLPPLIAIVKLTLLKEEIKKDWRCPKRMIMLGMR